MIAGPTRIRRTRSGLDETVHGGWWAVADASGGVLAASPGADTPFYFRSTIKPIQAWVSQGAGADLSPEQLAVASASHGGLPVHLAYVRRMLAEVDLDESALECPPDWPLSDVATRLATWAGHRRRRRIFHNCSGKHAAMLRACVASGWPTAGYSAADHPLQQRIVTAVADVSGFDPTPTGVDGCGIPTLRTTVVATAVTFARLSCEERYADVRTAISRFPGLVGDHNRSDGAFAAWWGGPVKAGAEGLIGAGRNGLGFAYRSHDGSSPLAVTGLVALTTSAGALSPAAVEALAEIAHPPLLGGGRPVGRVEVD